MALCKAGRRGVIRSEGREIAYGVLKCVGRDVMESKLYRPTEVRTQTHVFEDREVTLVTYLLPGHHVMKACGRVEVKLDAV